MILLACDLDNTLIHRHAGAEDVCVEYIDGKAHSFMSRNAYTMLESLDQRICLVPSTARSLAQYKRVTLFLRNIPQYAITSCGGTLLRKGIIDKVWQAGITGIVQAVSPEMTAVLDLLRSIPQAGYVKVVDNTFIFALSTVSDTIIQSPCFAAYTGKLSFINHNKKIYVIPYHIDKGAALDVIRSEVDACTLIAAGDSVLDIPLLNRADYALVPSADLAAQLTSPRISIKPDKSDFAAWILSTVILMSS
jgi:hydroxymethylpyrimidine pyrophosphatase-like HAD family hydrolase